MSYTKNAIEKDMDIQIPIDRSFESNVKGVVQAKNGSVYFVTAVWVFLPIEYDRTHEENMITL